MEELKKAENEAKQRYTDLCEQLFYMESGEEYNKVAAERDKAFHEWNVATGKVRGWEDYE